MLAFSFSGNLYLLSKVTPQNLLTRAGHASPRGKFVRREDYAARAGYGQFSSEFRFCGHACSVSRTPLTPISTFSS
eukprot:5039795-Pleurochrysis_carterae.AAC.1